MPRPEDRVNALLAASGILAGIMLVWVQLWQSTAEFYKSHGYRLRVAGDGLSYSYLAILGAFIAFILFIVSLGKPNHILRKYALGCLAFSLIITLIMGVLFAGNVILKSLLPPNSLIEPTRWGFLYWPVTRVVVLFLVPCIVISFAILVVNLPKAMVNGLIGFPEHRKDPTETQ